MALGALIVNSSFALQTPFAVSTGLSSRTCTTLVHSNKEESAITQKCEMRVGVRVEVGKHNGTDFAAFKYDSDQFRNTHQYCASQKEIKKKDDLSLRGRVHNTFDPRSVARCSRRNIQT